MCSNSIAVQGKVVCSFERLFLDGELTGVVIANGIRTDCESEGDWIESGGRNFDGRDDGGWFSASDDCRE